jgi:hypothetical protein
MEENKKKIYFFSIPILSLLVAALALVLSIFIAYRDGQLANRYLELDLQEKRPFLAPVMSSKLLEDNTRQKWSWGVKNSGSVIARLVYFDLDRKSGQDKWEKYELVTNEIVYPGETLELKGEYGKLSGICVSCAVFEEVKEFGKARRWVGYAQYFCTDFMERITKSGFEPELRLVHRNEAELNSEETLKCDAVKWWSNLPTVQSNLKNK